MRVSRANRRPEEDLMKAKVHDRILVHGCHVGDHDRRGEIVGVEGPEGAPPYRVHWYDTEHVTLFFPSSDAEIVPFGPERGTS
jgi:hypothetical protein